jgi:NADH-quinone oxidoreductase subunit H
MSFASIAHWYLELPAFVQALIRAVIWVLIVFAPVPIFIWWERRLLSWMQDRIGPNRVGNITFSRRSKWVPGFLKGRKYRLFGILQPIADGAKSFFKEDFAPANSDKFIYYLAPALAVFPAFAIGAVVPWSPWRSLTPVGNVDVGVLYILAISSLGVYGIVLAGYASNNKYSLMGGLRSSAQLISYELSMGMSLGAIALATGSLKPTDMLAAQEQAVPGVPFLQNWFVFTPFGFLALIVFLVCMVAETNRQPFDLPEAESELVSGYNTEYSTKRWVMFMMGEYVNMYIFGSIVMTVFLGGYNALPVNWAWLAGHWPGAALWNFLGGAQYWLAWLVFFLKGFAVISGYIWLRATLPRLRYDQLMRVGWTVLLPLATFNFMVVALWIVGTRLLSERLGNETGTYWIGWWCVLLILAAGLVLAKALRRPNTSTVTPDLASRRVVLVDPSLENSEVA